MDQIDREILQILSANSNATATQMMEQVNLSIPAINKRIQKLQSAGVIRQFTILLDPEKVGKSVQAFVLIVLQQRNGTDPFMAYVKSDPDILECYSVTGEYDFIMKVCATDVKSLDEKLVFLKEHRGVVKSYTMLSMTEYKYQASILPDRYQKGSGDQ